MDKYKLLSGTELVARGTTKSDASLPEIGLKDVIPNGSWLEQKQIQSALEARKHLIQVERIEKCGTLSQAEWREELMLAEVTRKVGGYWQYVGHNVGKQLFLNPEEALFLMEVNCLQLKYNEVTVSLQKAYSLLLRGKISLTKYKVYASLGRLGYKVFRHEDTKPTEYEKRINLTPIKKPDKINNDSADSSIEESSMEVDDGENVKNSEDDNLKDSETNLITHCTKTSRENENCSENVEVLESSDPNTDTALEQNDEVLDKNNGNKDEITNLDNHHLSKEHHINNDQLVNNPNKPPEENSKQIDSKTIYHEKLKVLENRKIKSCNSEILHKHFENIPDLFQKHIVTVKIPQEQHIPKNVFLNNITYVLNIESIETKNKNTRPSPTDSRYSLNEEVNGAHVRRVRDCAASTLPPNNWIPLLQPNIRYGGHSPHFRPFTFWRPRTNLNFYQFRMLFQRPFLPHLNFAPRFQMFPRPPMFAQFPNVTSTSNDNYGNKPRQSRKRDRSQSRHLSAIKKLAMRLKELIRGHISQTNNVKSLERLIDTYNNRYRTRLRLTDDMDIIDDNIVDTIELDCEDDTRNKRPRIEKTDDKYEENLNKLKQLALKLKDLDDKNKATARHRRAFSSAIKTFNKSYKADVYMNTNYDIVDRSHINLDSSSDSDCVVDETPTTSTRKLFINPLSLVKKFSQCQNSDINKPSTSKEPTETQTSMPKIGYSETLTKTFSKNWLPDENDFGRPEILSKNFMYTCYINYKTDEYIYEFIKNQTGDFDNWLSIKISFLKHVLELTKQNESKIVETDESGLKPIIGPEDSTDMSSILNKLYIIQTNKEVETETNLTVDFDVYNRDVQNFKKSNRPKPHFMVICTEESKNFPSGDEIAALRSKHDSNITILFAVVGIGSISYLQINPTDLPVYTPNSDLDLT